MLTPYNNEALNLEILAEEAAEVIQIKSKVVRFGLTDYHPKNEVPNRQALEREIGHFLVMVDILLAHGTINQQGIDDGKSHKLRRMPNWYFAGSRPVVVSNPLADSRPCTFDATCAVNNCHLPVNRCEHYKPLIGPVPVTEQQWPVACACDSCIAPGTIGVSCNDHHV